MKKRLLLVTHGFPFGESERSFMTEEVRQLSAAFDLMILAPDDEGVKPRSCIPQMVFGG